MQADWITMEALGTFGGAVMVVTLIAQFLKGPLDSLVKMPTRAFVLVLAWLLLLARRYVAGGDLAFEGVFLDLINGFMVTLASMGAHAVAKDTMKWT